MIALRRRSPPPPVVMTCRRVGTMFCKHPEWYETVDNPGGKGVDDMIVRQAEGARAGGRKLCTLERWGLPKEGVTRGRESAPCDPSRGLLPSPSACGGGGASADRDVEEARDP